MPADYPKAIKSFYTYQDQPWKGALLPDGSDPSIDYAYITNEINDDLNLPRALAVAWETLRGGLPAVVRKATLLRFDAVFGLGLATWTPKQEIIPDAIATLAEARLAARASKNWDEADRLRAELHAAGWEMEDRPQGYALKRR